MTFYCASSLGKGIRNVENKLNFTNSCYNLYLKLIGGFCRFDWESFYFASKTCFITKVSVLKLLQRSIRYINYLCILFYRIYFYNIWNFQRRIITRHQEDHWKVSKVCKPEIWARPANDGLCIQISVYHLKPLLFLAVSISVTQIAHITSNLCILTYWV